MCLGIPAHVVELLPGDDRLATVDVSGVHRVISTALFAEGEIGEGDWVLVHVGFAMSKIDEEEAAATLAALHVMGGSFTEDMEALLGARAREARDGRAGGLTSGSVP
jgi:hydrogenase expression/formation protein HypC